MRGRLNLALLLAVVNGFAHAGRPPLQALTVADGLPHDRVMGVTEDSRGFIWFATVDGLARYDGELLVRYGAEQGLGDRYIRTLRDVPGGEYWVGTDHAGLYRFDSSHAPARFDPVPLEGRPQTVTTIVQAPEGTLWVGTTSGLYLGSRKGSAVGWERLPVTREVPFPVVWALLPETSGSLWIGTASGLFRRCSDGRDFRHPAHLAGTSDDVRAIASDGAGRLYIGGVGGIAVFRIPERCGDEPVLLAGETARLRALGLDTAFVRAILVTRSGQLWIGSPGALFRLHDGTVDTYTTEDGLTDETVRSLAEDRVGNVWAATDQGGVLRFSPEGFHSYRETEGMKLAWTSHLMLDADGSVVAAASLKSFSHVWNGRVEQVASPLPPQVIEVSLQQTPAIDRQGEWWLPTPFGLYRYQRPRRLTDLTQEPPTAIYGAKNGLPGNAVDLAWEDGAGNVWLSAWSEGQRWLARWERATGQFRTFNAADGLGVPSAALSFVNDEKGGVLVGFEDGHLARFDGTRFAVFTAAEGLPEGPLAALHFGPKGRTWIAGRGSIVEMFSSGLPRPSFHALPIQNDFHSEEIRCLVEDDSDHLFAGTVRGVFRIDLRSGSVRHYSRREGLPSEEVTSCVRDRAGQIWFGTLGGLARFEAGPDRPFGPPGIFLDRLRAGGRDLPVAPLGELHLGPVVADFGALIEVGAGSIVLSAGEVILYQHRLGPDGAWSAPSASREISLAGLSPGKYQIEIRAVNADGASSTAPATVDIVVLAPVWRRAWFLGTVGLLLFTAATLALRAREQRLVARARLNALTEANRNLERRVEEGIARLSASERFAAYGQLVAGVAHEVRHPVFALRTAAYLIGQRGTDDPSLAGPLATLRDETDRITRLVDDLLSFARQPNLAVRTISARAILDMAVKSFHAARPDAAVDIVTSAAHDLPMLAIDPDRVVQVLLNLLTNAIQHGHARHITLSAKSTEDGPLAIAVADDGGGIPEENLSRLFEPFFTGGRGGTGLGLAISRRLVEAHGGTIVVTSEPGHGTTFTITLPAAP